MVPTGYGKLFVSCRMFSFSFSCLTARLWTATKEKVSKFLTVTVTLRADAATAAATTAAATTAATTAAAAASMTLGIFGLSYVFVNSSPLTSLKPSLITLQSTRANNVTLCDGVVSSVRTSASSAQAVAAVSGPSSAISDLKNAVIADPSWIRRGLARIGVPGSCLPLPRRVRQNDPDLQVSSRLLRQRASDEQRLPALQRQMAEAVQARDTVRAQQLVMAVYQLLYGIDNPQARTDFLLRYGCTGWNQQVLETLSELGKDRGFVEIGAGHGQWARALESFRWQQYQQQQQQQLEQDSNAGKQRLPHPRTFVRAYDNHSQLPLNPNVYHAKTAPHAHFFGNVLPCPNVDAALAQFENRGRILLLVYPSPDSDMAVHALRAYSALGPHNDTLVYVGEGRGGANANDAFFDALVQRGSSSSNSSNNNDNKQSGTHDDDKQDDYYWCLLQIMPAVPCGTKGEERVYIFQRKLKHAAT